MSYNKPPLNSIPFTFGSGGYSPLDLNAIDFNFISSTMSSVLGATIEGSLLYQTEAYTYPKQCKKVAIGFDNGLVQFLSLPCLFGGIRDLGSALRVYQRDYISISANISIFYSGTADLNSSITCGTQYVGTFSNIIGSIEAHLPQNLLSRVEGQSPGELNAIIGTCAPKDLNSILHGYQLDSIIASIIIEQPSDLQSYISTVPPYNLEAEVEVYPPINLLALLGASPPKSITGSIHGWELSYLSSEIVQHNPIDLYSDIIIHDPIDIVASVVLYPPVNFPAEIVIYPPVNLTGSLHSWQLGNIQAGVGGHSPKDLYSIIEAYDPIDIEGIIGISAPKNIDAYIDSHIPESIYGSIHGWGIHNLSAKLVRATPFELYSSMGAHAPYDLLSVIVPSLPKNLAANILACLPANLYASLRGWQITDLSASTWPGNPMELYAGISPQLPSNLSSVISMQVPSDISSFIGTHLYSYLHSSIRGWALYNLTTTIATHLAQDILAYLNTLQRSYTDISFSLYGWQEYNLSAYVKNCYELGLHAQIYSGTPKDLSAVLRIWYYNNLTTTVRGWGTYDIQAILHPFFKGDLLSSLYPIPPYDLKGTIKVISVGVLNIPALIRAFHTQNLRGAVHPFYIKDLSSYLYPIGSINLKGTAHGYDERFLQGRLFGLEYPYNITASIAASGGWVNLNASLKAYAALKVFKELSATLGGYQASDILASLLPIPGHDLGAFLNISSYSTNLQAILVPKVVRLSKIVGVFTIEHFDLSAMINTSCFGSDIRHLTAYIKTIYLCPLSATINGVVTYKDYLNLSATIGMDNSVLVIDRLPLTITTAPAVVRTIDELPLVIRLYGGSQNISANIMCMLTTFDLSAQIKAVAVEDYEIIKNVSKALVYDLKTTYGRAELSKVVEISFRNYVRDYIYLQKAGITFGNNSSEKWEVDIMSYLPANLTLNTKRKFYKATVLYKLTSYRSIDEAVKEAIVYITEMPYNNLSADINLYFNSMSINLLAGITPLYIKSDQNDLNSNIVGEAPPVVYSKGTEFLVSSI